MLENLAAEGRPALDLCGDGAVFGDTHRFGNGVIVDPRPVAVFGNQTNGEPAIKRVERVAERLERCQIPDRRQILDAEIRAVLLFVENAQHVVKQILKGQRAVFEAGRDHRHVSDEPEIPALHRIRPGLPLLVEGGGMDLRLRGIDDFQTAEAEIKLILRQIGFFIDDARMLGSRIGQKPKTITRLEGRFVGVIGKIPSLAPEIHPDPNERPGISLKVCLENTGQRRFVPDRREIESRIVSLQISREVFRKWLPDHSGLEMPEQVLKFRRVDFAEPAVLALIVVKNENRWAGWNRIDAARRWYDQQECRQNQCGQATALDPNSRTPSFLSWCVYSCFFSPPSN